ncbi:hypothetical protein CRUP_023543, partial [Coryphaenoides rupestris]
PPSATCTSSSTQPPSATSTQHLVAVASPLHPAVVTPTEVEQETPLPAVAGPDSGPPAASPPPSSPSSSSRVEASPQEAMAAPADGGVESLGVELCQQVAQELRQAVESGVPEQRALLLSVLQEALSSAHADLAAAAQLSDRKCSRDSAHCGPVADDRTTELLEKYSDLLLDMTRRKMQQSIMGDVVPGGQ